MDSRALELLRPLGEGGFGTVWLAKLHGRDGFSRRVAVKVMKEAHVADDIVARQRDEARLLGLLQHPHIVAVYDLTEHNGLPAVIMEYVEGLDVASLTRLCGPLPVPAAIEVAAAVAGALDAGWNALAPDTSRPLRVIHRDIKPANVLLTVHGTVKVLDFGVARADFDREGHTQSMAFGTPRFMAPEQFLGGEFGAGNDVYALGVTLWEMLTARTWGRPPLVEEAFMKRVWEQVAEVDVSVRPLLHRMLSWDPARRPTTREVGDTLDGLAVPGEKLRAWSQRVLPDAMTRHAAALLVRSRSDGALRSAGSVLPTAPSRVPLGADSGASLAAPAPAPPAPRPGVNLALAAGAATAILAGLLVLGVGGAWLALRSATPDNAGAEPAAPEPVAGPVAEVEMGASTGSAEASGAGAPGTAVGETPAAAGSPEPAPSTSRSAGRTGSAGGSRAGGAGNEGPSGAELVAGLGGGEAEPAPARPATATPAVATKTTPAPSPKESVPAPESAPAPTVAAAPAAEPAARTRSLKILADVIGATVWIDGARVGSTPLPARQLTYGSHRVEIEVAGSRGGRTIEVDANTPGTLRYRSKEGAWVWE